MNQLVHPASHALRALVAAAGARAGALQRTQGRRRRLRSQAHACELSVTDRSRPPTPFTGPSYRRLTVARFESGDVLKTTTVEQIQHALERAGVVFVHANDGGPGVRLQRW